MKKTSDNRPEPKKPLDYQSERSARLCEKYSELQTRLPDYVVAYLDAKRAANCALSTVVAYADDFVYFLEYLIRKNPSESPLFKNIHTKDISLSALETLTFNDINKFQGYMKDGIGVDGVPNRLSQAAIARRMSSIRGFFEHQYTHHCISRNPVDGAEKIKLKNDKEIDTLEKDQIRKLIGVIETAAVPEKMKPYCEKNKARDLAIVTLLSNTGIRISECVGLDVEDVDLEESSIFVTRKGGTYDKVYFNDKVSAALGSYIELDREQIYHPLEGEKALFLTSRHTRMQVRSIEIMLKKYAAIALPAKKRVYPHLLRKTYGTALYAKTGDIKMVSEVLGHERIETTSRFYAKSAKKKEAAKYDLF